MNRFWLKITGLVVVAVIVIAGVYVLWHAKTPHSGQTPKQRASKLATEPKRQLKPEDFQSAAASRLQDIGPKEQELRQKAVLLSTLYRDPNSPEAAKARELLLKAPEGVEEQYRAAQRKRNLPFLNLRRDQNDIELLPKPSQQPSDQNDDHATQMQPQQLSNAQPENIKEFSDKLLEEHLKHYKVTRNEMFPMYLDSAQSGIPADVLYRLPAPYLRQLETSNIDARAGQLPAGSRQDGVKQPNTAGMSIGARSLQRFDPQGTGQSNPMGNKVSVGSFKSFNPEAAKRLPPSTQRNDANQPTSQMKK
jgi:hypothetical protein